MELWYDQQPSYIQDRVRQVRSLHVDTRVRTARRPDGHTGIDGDAIDERTQRSYRLIDNIHSAIKTLQILLPPEDPSLKALLQAGRSGR